MTKEEQLGKETTKILKDNFKMELCTPAPKTFIDSEKDTILFIGMNPAGNQYDVKREKETDGLFLNYYKELDSLNESWFCNNDSKEKIHAFIYKPYFKPILEFFKEVTGKDKIAWEWCNRDFNDLIKTMKKVRNIDTAEEKILNECYEKYKYSEYQIVMRDLVYYHQTSNFNKILKPKNDKIVKETIKKSLEEHIKSVSKSKLKLIYVSSATSCNYIEEALKSYGCSMDERYGAMYFNNIPLIFAGRALNGAGVIDKYSKNRLIFAVKELLNK